MYEIYTSKVYDSISNHVTFPPHWYIGIKQLPGLRLHNEITFERTDSFTTMTNNVTSIPVFFLEIFMALISVHLCTAFQYTCAPRNLLVPSRTVQVIRQIARDNWLSDYPNINRLEDHQDNMSV